MGKIELKPCPFCDGDAELIDDDGSHGKVYSVWHQCPRNGGKFNKYGSVCKLTIDTGWYDTEEEAAAAWNTRHERTCIIIGFTSAVRDSRGLIEYPPVWNLSCGHEAAWWKPQKCPSCGAKVV